MSKVAVMVHKRQESFQYIEHSYYLSIALKLKNTCQYIIAVGSSYLY
jgi:hypothetical protein